MSSKIKIAFLFSLLVTLTLTILSLLIFYFTQKERTNTYRDRLQNRASSTARVYANIKDSNYSILRSMDAGGVASLYNKSVTIVGLNGSHDYLYSDQVGDSLYMSQSIIEKTKTEDRHFFDYGNKKGVAIHFTEDNNNFIVAIAALDLDGQEFLGFLKKILWLALLIAASLSFLTGLIFAGNLIRPITRITTEMNLITASNFSRRINIDHKKDELSKLALTFNNLLDRLQDSFAIQRRFISNASHELSTPLTSISSQLEVAMQKNRESEEYREVMQSVYEDIKGLQHLTRSLLDIAKAGSQGSIELAEVRLDEILFKVVSDVKKQNAGYKSTLNFDLLPEDEKLLTVFGNANLLYIALKNIVENGCKYSDNHQSIITVFFDKSMIEIKVTNKGDIISEADIQNIFQPFFRTDSAHNKPGFGLGLTLTKRILALHKGSISVESNLDKGTVFSIRLTNILT
jgi:signal transduction histidine kinase